MYNVNSKIQTIVKRLPLMAAILGAGLAMLTSLSSFTSKNEPLNRSKVDLYWFAISGDYNPTDSIPASDASFIGYGNAPDPSSTTICSGSTHLCVAGFNSSQVNISGTSAELINDNQQAVNTSYRKD